MHNWGTFSDPHCRQTQINQYHTYLLSLLIDNVFLGMSDVIKDVVIDILIHMYAGPVLGSLSGQKCEQ